jgi:hypothetical protein
MSGEWREWTREQRKQSAASAAYLFMNMSVCEDCGLPWPEGYTHGDNCPGPAHVQGNPVHRDCPNCKWQLERGVPFTALPCSETYWSS